MASVASGGGIVFGCVEAHCAVLGVLGQPVRELLRRGRIACQEVGAVGLDEDGRPRAFGQRLFIGLDCEGGAFLVQLNVAFALETERGLRPVGLKLARNLQGLFGFVVVHFKPDHRVRWVRDRV